ncbi:lipopolysaccharide biosynthesis protein [Amphibiibacter pelophylacis]|uniref:Uncharacterized protein n=1 Tax=Amphibiibacter pelophylacis TaxID=1799477 RepID=A0ACC6P301_9BURK
MIDPRSARSNIVWSMAAKLVSLLVSIFSVPLLLQMLGTQQYGTWVTLTSLVAFISLLDLGVGNSMRNSVASLDDTNSEAVRFEFIGFFRLLCYVGLIASAGFIFTIAIGDVAPRNSYAMLLLYLPILMLLPLMLGASVLQGARATGVQAILQASGGWAFFVCIGFWAWIDHSPSINSLALIWSFFYLVSLLLVFALALSKLHLPFSRLFGVSIAGLPRGRLSVGLEFLVLQLSSLVLYSLGNILIFKHLGAGEVARYDVLNKMYQVGLSLYSVVIGVMWPEITRARAARNEKLLKNIFWNLAMIAGFFFAVALLGAFAAPSIVSLWTQHRIQVETREALAIAGLAVAQALAYVGAVFMNSFEKIRLQILLGVASIVCMIPLSTYFMNLGVGIASVPLAALLLTISPMVICNICALHLIRGMKKYE